MGESHKIVELHCEGQGLIRAAVFGVKGKNGAAKRALIQPFSLCQGDFYFDPVKKLWRLNDGVVLESRDSYHLNLNKYYAALFWADLSIQSHGGGGSSDFFEISGNYYRALQACDPEDVPELFLRSLWDYLAYEGIQPQTDSCALCGRKAPPERSLCYNSEGNIICSRCRLADLPVLSSEGRNFLERGPRALSTEESRNLSAYILSILKNQIRLKMDKKSLDIILIL